LTQKHVNWTIFLINIKFCSFPFTNKQKNYVSFLDCLYHVLNSLTTSSKYNEYSYLIPFIFNSINLNLPLAFSPTLKVFCFFVLKNEQEDTHFEHLKKIVHSIEQIESGWSTFASELKRNRNRQFITSLVNFLNEFYFSLSNRYRLRFHISTLIHSSGIFSELKNWNIQKMIYFINLIKQFFKISQQILSLLILLLKILMLTHLVLNIWVEKSKIGSTIWHFGISINFLFHFASNSQNNCSQILIFLHNFLIDFLFLEIQLNILKIIRIQNLILWK
jgi:hypothetical protein